MVTNQGGMRMKEKEQIQEQKVDAIEGSSQHPKFLLVVTLAWNLWAFCLYSEHGRFKLGVCYKHSLEPKSGRKVHVRQAERWVTRKSLGLGYSRILGVRREGIRGRWHEFSSHNVWEFGIAVKYELVFFWALDPQAEHCWCFPQDEAWMDGSGAQFLLLTINSRKTLEGEQHPTLSCCAHSSSFWKHLYRNSCSDNPQDQ